MSEFDAHRFLSDLRRGVDEQNQVVSERVPPPVTAQSLLDLTSLVYYWAESQGTSHRSDTFPTWQPLKDSLAYVEGLTHEQLIASFLEQNRLSSGTWLDTNPTRNMVGWSMEVMRRCLLTTLDSLAGAAVLLSRPGHSRAPIILARSALEATATLAGLVDPTIDSKERSRRLLNLRLSEIHEAAEGESGSVDLQEMLAFAEHIGFTPVRPRSRWTAPFLPGANGRADSSAQAIERALPSVGRDFWRTQSAVTHSRAAAMLIADEYAAPHAIDPGRQAESASFNILPSVLVLTEMLPSISAFTGWSAFEHQDVVQRCHRALSSCAGLDDRAIRGRLGFD